MLLDIADASHRWFLPNILLSIIKLKKSIDFSGGGMEWGERGVPYSITQHENVVVFKLSKY